MAYKNLHPNFNGRVIPQLYQEVYSLCCPTSECLVDKNVFVKFMNFATSIAEDDLGSIWKFMECKQGVMDRSDFFTGLTMIAIFQQGREIHDKIIEDYTEIELPVPTLKDTEHLRTFSKKMWQQLNPSFLNVKFEDLVKADVATVELVPEKKGIILKHVEYVVTSQRHKSKVNRRYNDFLAFYETLLLKFQYRMIPRLPPKKMMMGANAKFIDQRRKALNRFLTLVVRHPVIGDDKIVDYFLTYNGPDAQQKIKNEFRNTPDEFLLSDISSKNDLVPQNGRVNLATSREQIHFIYTSLMHVEEIVESMVARSQEYTADLMNLQKELSSLANEPRATSLWATGGISTWDHIKKGCRSLSQAFGQLSVRTKCQKYLQEDEIIDQLNLLLDLLASYKDLYDRHEKGAMQEHQKVMSRVINIRKKVQQASAQGTDTSSETIHTHIAEQENHIQAMEKRSQFALHCLHLETQYVHVSLEILVTVFKSMAEVFSFSYAEMSRMWDGIQPIVASILPDSVVTLSTNGTGKD